MSREINLILCIINYKSRSIVLYTITQNILQVTILADEICVALKNTLRYDQVELLLIIINKMGPQGTLQINRALSPDPRAYT